MNREYILTIQCPDRPGIVYAVSSFLIHCSGNILESQQFDDRSDPDDQRFFMRVQFEVYDEAMTLERLRDLFAPVAVASDMTWELWHADAKYRTLIMVSREGHCLNDLLYRQSIGSLPIEVPAVVSNHTDLERLAKSYGVPFHHVPVTPGHEGRRRGDAARARVVARTSTWSCSRATCRSCRTRRAPPWPGARSTSTTRSCRASRARSRTSRRMRAA